MSRTVARERVPGDAEELGGADDVASEAESLDAQSALGDS